MRPRSTVRLLWPVLLIAILAMAGSCTAAEDSTQTVPGGSTTASSDALTGATTSSPVERLSGQSLISALRDGGQVIYFRHAKTNPEPDDADPVVLSDCSTQRNLSEQGRAQASAVGRAFQELRIPVGDVLSSPFCRALDTARLAFGRATSEPLLENLETAENDAERDERVAGLRRLLSAKPEGAGNVVLVAHGFNISAVTDESLPEGGAAVFRPQGEDGFVLVGTVAPEQWVELAEGLRDRGTVQLQEYPVPAGGRPHDVAPAEDGTVWYTAQGSGDLGRLHPESGEVTLVPLGAGSAPHGVIVGPDGAAWVTDSGLNAILRVDPETLVVDRFPLPGDEGANLNTAAFDGRGNLWFTGQAGYYGRVELKGGRVDLYEAPRGRGPYGITATPQGDVYYASLGGSHIARIDIDSGEATVLEPPTEDQGARRIWSDSRGRLWISEWDAGQLGMYDPASEVWREWRLPGENPQPYAVFVDEEDEVWLSDFGANALVRFDPGTEEFTQYPLPSKPGEVRQILGRPGEVWGAESAADALIVARR